MQAKDAAGEVSGETIPTDILIMDAQPEALQEKDFCCQATPPEVMSVLITNTTARK